MPKAAPTVPQSRGTAGPRGVEEPSHAWTSTVGTWEGCGPPRQSCRGREGKEQSGLMMMNGPQQSDGVIVCAGQRPDRVGWSPTDARVRGVISKGASYPKVGVMPHWLG